MREKIEKKIKELEWTTSVKSIIMIDWLKSLLAELPEEKKEEPKKEIKVEVPEPPKKKISFNKKKQMFIEFEPTEKQAEALQYWMDDTTTEI